MNALSSKIHILILVLVSLAYHITYGLETLVPTNISWLMSAYHDWGQHYLGWAYYRVEDWSFPLGAIQNYNYPSGTNIGYTDSIPLFAIFFKVFNFLLPDTFQYFGLWLFLSHYLTAFFSVKILDHLKFGTISIIVIALLIAFNPVLVYRSMHPALCAHWLIIASIYLYIKNANKENITKDIIRQAFLVILSAMINPYLFLFVIGFGLIKPFKAFFYDKLISLKNFIIFSLFPIIFSVIIWIIIGMVSYKSGVKMDVSNSYGLYSFNLNSFINSSGYSAFFPALKNVSAFQYEGYGYLGLGLVFSVIFSVISLVVFFKKIRFNIKTILLGLLSVLYLLFAITNEVTLNDTVLFDFYLPKILIKLGNIFRASGRFCWLFYYLMIFFSFYVINKTIRLSTLKLFFLSIILIVQVLDLKPMLTTKNFEYGNFTSTKINQEKWVDFTSKFSKIITYKPFENSLNYHSSYQDLCFVALQNRIPITCGYVARETVSKNSVYLDSLETSLKSGIFENKSVYITNKDYINSFSDLITRNNMALRYFDDFYLIYSNRINTSEFRMSAEEKKHLDSLKNVIKPSRSLYKTLNINDFISKDIELFVERIHDTKNALLIDGWAFIETKTNTLGDSIYIGLKKGNTVSVFETDLVKRPDVTTSFNKENIDNSGFSVAIFKSDLQKGVYDLGLVIKSKSGSWHYQSLKKTLANTNKTYTVKKRNAVLIETNDLKFNIESIQKNSNDILITGWTFIEDQSAFDPTIKIILKNDSFIFEVDCDIILRKDVTSFFNSEKKYNLNSSGFETSFEQLKLNSGTYQIGLKIIDVNKKEHYVLSNKELIIE